MPPSNPIPCPSYDPSLSSTRIPDISSALETASLASTFSTSSLSRLYHRTVPSQLFPSRISSARSQPALSLDQGDVFGTRKRIASRSTELGSPKRPKAYPVAATSPVKRRSPRYTTSKFATLQTLPLPSDAESMSLFAPVVDYLEAKVHVELGDGGKIDMIGGPNTGTSYSLAGHVVLTLPTLPDALKGRLREIVQLELLLEGKSEFFDEEGRYAPFRLCRETLDLSGRPQPYQILSEDPNKPRSRCICVAIPFDLRLPGWLPPSHSSDLSSTSYGVIAKARLGWTSPTLAVPRKLQSNCSLAPDYTTFPSSQITRFLIHRHRLPSAVVGLAPERQERHYTLKPETNSFESPVECVVTVPDWVDVYGEEKSLKVSLRMRAKKSVVEEDDAAGGSEAGQADATGDAPALSTASAESSSPVPMERQALSPETGNRNEAEDVIMTHVVELGMEVEEVERYSSAAAQTFHTSYPIPEAQPSVDGREHPLIDPAPHAFLGPHLGNSDTEPFRGQRSRSCLLADDGTQRNFWFSGEGLGLGDKWRKINIVLPMPAEDRVGKSRRPTADLDGAFLKIKHSLKIRVVCRNVNSDGTPVSMMLSTPIRFGTSLSTLPDASSSSAPPLPAYIQLFHENGDLRQCDPLPLYSGPAQIAAPVVASHTLSPIASKLASPMSPTPSYDSLFPSAHTHSRSPSPSGSRSINSEHESDHSEHNTPDVESKLLAPGRNLYSDMTARYH